jgi:ACS family tartrate transporter-like MFS transporter
MNQPANPYQAPAAVEHVAPQSGASSGVLNQAALNSARFKAYVRLLPLLFICYVIAYIDRSNVAFAKLHMMDQLGFDEKQFGFGMGIFFFGYILLEIPGTLLVERWSASKWISRIMISWGIVAALTAWVTQPWHFYGIRFLLGVAEAGFFPGIIVYLTHWFPRADRTKALAWFFIGTPIAQMISPPICAALMSVEEPLWGLAGWQWVYVFWGIPAVILGLVVIFRLTDRPHQARWLTDDEKFALETTLQEEKKHVGGHGHMSIMQGLSNPKVLALAAAYFFVVTGNYGVEMYMASILEDWYKLKIQNVGWLVVIPPIGSIIGQLLIGWNSDRTHERRYHATLPIIMGAIAIALAPFSNGYLWLTVLLFTIAMTGLKAYLPAFWALPSLFLTSSAAAASIGLINSFGNLGGWVGPSVIGYIKGQFNNYGYGLWFVSCSMLVSAAIIFALNVRAQPKAGEVH